MTSPLQLAAGFSCARPLGDRPQGLLPKKASSIPCRHRQSRWGAQGRLRPVARSRAGERLLASVVERNAHACKMPRRSSASASKTATRWRCSGRGDVNPQILGYLSGATGRRDARRNCFPTVCPCELKTPVVRERERGGGEGVARRCWANSLLPHQRIETYCAIFCRALPSTYDGFGEKARSSSSSTIPHLAVKGRLA